MNIGSVEDKRMTETCVFVLCMHGLDFITGLIKAVKNNDIESSKMRDGLFKKAGYLLCYAVAYLFDTKSAGLGLTLGVDILPCVVCYAMLTEVVSIFENITVFAPGVVPTWLVKMVKSKAIENVSRETSEETDSRETTEENVSRETTEENVSRETSDEE